jgi:hypothetical protein
MYKGVVFFILRTEGGSVDITSEAISECVVLFLFIWISPRAIDAIPGSTVELGTRTAKSGVGAGPLETKIAVQHCRPQCRSALRGPELFLGGAWGK